MQCPICKKEFPDQPPESPATFPFCSERCKLIDLGRWLRGVYQVPVVDRDDRGADRSSPNDKME